MFQLSLDTNENWGTGYQAVIDAGPHYNIIKSRAAIIGVYINLAVITAIISCT